MESPLVARVKSVDADLASQRWQSTGTEYPTMKVVVFKVDDPLSLGVLDICVSDIPLVWNDPIKNRIPEGTEIILISSSDSFRI